MAHGFEHFTGATLAPAPAFRRADAQAMLEHALRPGVVVAIGDLQDRDVGSPAHGMLDQATQGP